MKEDVKNLWVDALRSGKYVQARGGLKKIDRDKDRNVVAVTHCCLGVLCEIAIESGVPVKVNDDTESKNLMYVYFDGAGAFTPVQVQEWSGLQSLDGRLIGTAFADETSLSHMNDNGSTFTEIAQFIEDNWKDL